MRKILLMIMAICLALALVCCGEDESTSSPEVESESVSISISESDTTPESKPESKPESAGGQEKHPHTLKRVYARNTSCRHAGNIEYWECRECEKYFLDSEGKTEITKADTIIAQLPHTTYFVEGEGSTCYSEGYIDHYACETCRLTFADEDATIELEESEMTVAKIPHDTVHHPRVDAHGNENGKLEYWQCNYCERIYLDVECETETTESALVIKPPYTLVDFVVEVREDKDPVVLQLSDTQIIYGEYARDGRVGWHSSYKNQLCYNYLTEIINAVKPDLIIITGDVVYGEFDDEGVALLYLIEFMESFDIPWAPVFGNHDNESKKGADWQCDQFEAAENCLFLQRTLTGNGNYSIGIAQGGYITRTFYMLDSNGCGSASRESLLNGHTKTSPGFGADQIKWYTSSITELRKSAPAVKISFAYHIQQAIFAKAYEKYGFVQNESTMKANPINIDTHPDKASTDFGYIGSSLKGPWDTNYATFNAMVALGVDSIFVGHEHLNSASVVYEGVRFQFGQKSSEYDRFNYLKKDGKIGGGFEKPSGATAIIGGTVIPLDSDGVITNPYIYYCGDIFGTNP